MIRLHPLRSRLPRLITSGIDRGRSRLTLGFTPRTPFRLLVSFAAPSRSKSVYIASKNHPGPEVFWLKITDVKTAVLRGVEGKKVAEMNPDNGRAA